MSEVQRPSGPPPQPSETSASLLSKDFPLFDIALLVGSVALFAIGAALNLSAGHILDHVNVIGFKFLESLTLGTGAFFTAVGFARVVKNSIDEGGFIARLTSAEELPAAPFSAAYFFQLLVNESTPSDAIRSGIGSSQFISNVASKTTVKTSDGKEATLYGIYPSKSVETRLKTILSQRAGKNLEALKSQLEMFAMQNECNLALKIENQVIYSSK